MDRLEKIRSILSETDQKLLELLAEFATAGNLAGVDTARGIVGRLRSLRDSLENGASPSQQASESRNRRRSSRERKPTEIRAKVPRFEVRNATLYRIGWSKKKSEQYVHKVPRDRLNDVVDAMVSLNQSGTGPFTVEQIIQRADQKSSVSIPNYQVYVVVGWLRAHKLIEQIGRDGYQMAGNLEGEVEALWNSSTPKR